MLIIAGALVIISVIGYFVYKKHMHYEIEAHESYNVAVLDKEGRTYPDSSVVYMTKDISPEGLMKAVWYFLRRKRPQRRRPSV